MSRELDFYDKVCYTKNSQLLNKRSPKMDINFYLIVILTMLSVYLFFKKVEVAKAKPIILAWFIISITTIIALFSFIFNLQEINEESVNKGALFFANSGASAAIFLRLLYLGGYNLRLKVFDKISGIAALSILIYWLLSDNPFVANLCTQGLMVISYLLILERVFETQGESDDHWFWLCAVGMSILSLTSIQGGGILETVNTYRSIISTGAVLSAIYCFSFQRKAV